jgi:hypothetical protein
LNVREPDGNNTAKFEVDDSGAEQANKLVAEMRDGAWEE